MRFDGVCLPIHESLCQSYYLFRVVFGDYDLMKVC